MVQIVTHFHVHIQKLWLYCFLILSKQCIERELIGSFISRLNECVISEVALFPPFLLTCRTLLACLFYSLV